MDRAKRIDWGWIMIRSLLGVTLLLVATGSAGAQDAGVQDAGVVATDAEQPDSNTSQNTSQPQGLIPPTLVNAAEAVFPKAALTDRIAATLVVDLELDTSGQVVSSSVSEKSTQTPEGGSPGPIDAKYGFDRAAMLAAAALTFTPATDNGLAIPVQISYTFHFVLPAAAPEPASSLPVALATVPEPVVNFRGQLLERGTRKNLAGVIVTVYRGEQGYEATSAAQGNFEFRDLEVGKWNVLVDAEGYYPYKTSEDVGVGELIEATYYLERKSYNEYDLVVEGERVKKEVNRRTLSAADIVKVPGTLGDPIQVVQNLPGVARSAAGPSGPGGGSNIIVRGAGSEDTGIFISGVSVPLIYHFADLKSVIPATVIDSIEFYPGNFSVEYGRALGGILNANLKELKPDRIHGSVDLSLLDTSLYLEAPIGDNAAIAIAARRSYLDVVLNAVIPDDTDLAFTTAPRYYDYQILGNWKPKPAHDFRIALLGSDDEMRVLFDDPANGPGIGASSGDVSTGTAFQRLMGEYRYTPSERFRNRLTFSVGRDIIDFSGFGEVKLDLEGWAFQLRDTASYKLHENLRLNVGLDGLLSVTDGDVRVPTLSTEGEGTPEFGDLNATSFENRLTGTLAPFLEAEIALGPVRIVPGVRTDYYLATEKWTADPRIVGRYEHGDWAAKAGVAMVHQEATAQQTNEAIGNPDLLAKSAIQYSIGAEWSPKDHLRFDVTGFYNDMDNLVASSNALIERDGEVVPEVYNNSRTGRSYGMEVFLEHKFANNFRGWLSYTLSRAERFEEGEDEARLFDNDQTHILAVVGSYLLPQNWELGLRWRYVTGNPLTPVVGATFIEEDDEYAPINGEINSDRLESFHQLDLRVDKTWVYDSWRLSTYLSLVNAYNRANPEGLKYNYDYSESSVASGLPILPILGIKGQW